MGHQHHFLSRLDRLSFPDVELALELYRDHELLRFLLSGVDLPEATERVAISLEDPRLGPFVIVTRDGRFVTCLARGMRTGALPVITRVQLDGRMALAGHLRAKREERARLQEEHGSVGKLIDRMMNAGPELTREELTAMAAFQPLMAYRFLRVHLKLSTRLLEARGDIVRLFKRTDRPKPVTHPVLRAYWETFWGLGTLPLLATMGGIELLEGERNLPEKALTALTTTTVEQGVVALALRGTWAAAKLGKRVLSAYKRMYDEAETALDFATPVLALTAIGLRHARLQAEVRKALSSPPKGAIPELAKLSEMFTKLINIAFDAPEAAMHLARESGAKAITGLASAFREGSPYRFTREEDVPLDLAMTAAIQDRSQFLTDGAKLATMVMCLPWLARASAEQLFLPAEVLRVLHVPWRPEQTLTLVHGLIDLEKIIARPRREGPARKGPCPCGSGKKYKHCCEGAPPA